MESRNALRPRTRVLFAALALRSFTVQELAEFSGVKLASVHSLVRREPGYFEEIGKIETGRKGGQPVRYTIAAQSREKLRAELAALSQLVPRPQASEPPVSAETRFQVALSAARYAVNLLKDVHSPEQHVSLLQRAKIQVAGARGALRLAAQSPQLKEFQTALSSLQAEARALAVYREKEVPGQIVLAAQPVVSVEDIEAWLRDWSLEVEVDESSNPNHVVQGEIEQLVVSLLSLGGSWPQDRHVLFPAAVLASNLGKLGKTGVSALQLHIVSLVRDDAVLNSPEHFSALLGCAAILDAPDCLRPIMMGRPDFSAMLSGLNKRIALLCIARFACPVPGKATDEASLIAQHILRRSLTQTEDMQYLLPAALSARQFASDEGLHNFVRALYGIHPTLPPLTAREEGCLMRTLAVAFSIDKFSYLVALIPGLLAHPYGVRFLTQLGSLSHQALRLRTDDQHGFVISPTPDLRGAIDPAVPMNVSIPVKPDSSDAETLNRLLTRLSPTVAGPLQPSLASLEFREHSIVRRKTVKDAPGRLSLLGPLYKRRLLAARRAGRLDLPG